MLTKTYHSAQSDIVWTANQKVEPDNISYIMSRSWTFGLNVTKCSETWTDSSLSNKHSGQKKAQNPKRATPCPILLPASLLTPKKPSKKPYFYLFIQREATTSAQTNIARSHLHLFLYIWAYSYSISNCPPCLGWLLWNNLCFTPTCRVPVIAMVRWWISTELQALSAILSLWAIKQLYCILHTMTAPLKTCAHTFSPRKK